MFEYLETTIATTDAPYHIPYPNNYPIIYHIQKLPCYPVMLTRPEVARPRPRPRPEVARPRPQRFGLKAIKATVFWP